MMPKGEASRMDGARDGIVMAKPDIETYLIAAAEVGYREDHATGKVRRLKHEQREERVYVDISSSDPALIVHPRHWTRLELLEAIEGVRFAGTRADPFRHSTNFGAFPKRRHTGRNSISHGLKFGFESAAAIVRFLARLEDEGGDPPGDLDTDAGERIRRDLADAKPYLDGLPSTEREALVSARLGQGRFRAALVARAPSCPLTGCDVLAALRASHIKPWSHSTDMERLDPHNGLLLRADIDALFDVGFLSFEKSGSLLVSPAVGPNALHGFGLSPQGAGYMDYHRNNVFRG